MVYDPTVKEQEKDIEMWHKSFVGPLNLPESQILILAHVIRPVGGQQYQAPRSLTRFAFANTSLDSDDGIAAMREGFSNLMSGVAGAVLEKSKADMEASLLVAER